MAAISQARRYSPPPEMFAVAVANLFPLVGVVALGWNLAALVVLYWLEFGVLCFWTVVRAAFAGRPSEIEPEQLIVGALASKCVAVPVPLTDLRIRLSTLPVLVTAVPMLSLVWFVVGVTTVGVVGADALDSDALGSVVLAGFGILVSEGARTAFEYFYEGEYREHSAQTAIQGTFVRGTALICVGLFSAFLAAIADGSVATDDSITAVDPTVVAAPLLGSIVLAKFAFDLAGLYRDRLVEFDESTDVLIGWAYEPPTLDRVDAALPEADRRLRPTVAGRSLGGLSNARRRPGTWFVALFPGIFAALLALGGAWAVAIPLAAGGIVGTLLLAAIDYLLRYGAVEYRVGDDAVVAYDRLFRTPLWRIEPWDETGLRVERDRVDELLGTATVVVERSDRDLRLPRLREVDPVLDVFDRRADGPSFDRARE